MALPLAPVELFEEGLQIIQKEAEELFTEHPSILLFITYLRHTWLPIKNEVSVFHIPIRTNNLVESFQYALLRKIGGVHTNIWHFLHKLHEVITDQEINLTRLKEGQTVRRVRVQYNIIRDRRIAEAQNLLSTGRYSLKEFLLSLSNVTQSPEENYDINVDRFEDLEIYSDEVEASQVNTNIVQEQNLPQEILHTEQEVIAHSCDYSHFSIFEEFESSGVSQSQNNCSLQVATDTNNEEEREKKRQGDKEKEKEIATIIGNDHKAQILQNSRTKRILRNTTTTLASSRKRRQIKRPTKWENIEVSRKRRQTKGHTQSENKKSSRKRRQTKGHTKSENKENTFKQKYKKTTPDASSDTLQLEQKRRKTTSVRLR